MRPLVPGSIGKKIPDSLNGIIRFPGYSELDIFITVDIINRKYKIIDEIVSNAGLKTGISWSHYDLLQFLRLISSLNLRLSDYLSLFDCI